MSIESVARVLRAVVLPIVVKVLDHRPVRQLPRDLLQSRMRRQAGANFSGGAAILCVEKPLVKLFPVS